MSRAERWMHILFLGAVAVVFLATRPDKVGAGLEFVLGFFIGANLIKNFPDL